MPACVWVCLCVCVPKRDALFVRLNLQRLYEMGADINIISRTAKDTPLHVAAANNSTDFITELLLLRADPTKPNAAGKTACDVAVDNGHEAAAALLRSHVRLADASDLAKHLWPAGGPASGNRVEQAVWDKFKTSLTEHNVNSISRSYGVIHHLCCANQPHLIREIIEQYGADPNLKARYSCKTPLHIAAKKGYTRCAEVLLELGGSLRCFDHARRPPQQLARAPETVAAFAPFVIQMREQHRGRTPQAEAGVSLGAMAQSVGGAAREPQQAAPVRGGRRCSPPPPAAPAPAPAVAAAAAAPAPTPTPTTADNNRSPSIPSLYNRKPLLSTPHATTATSRPMTSSTTSSPAICTRAQRAAA